MEDPNPVNPVKVKTSWSLSGFMTNNPKESSESNCPPQESSNIKQEEMQIGSQSPTTTVVQGIRDLCPSPQESEANTAMIRVKPLHSLLNTGSDIESSSPSPPRVDVVPQIQNKSFKPSMNTNLTIATLSQVQVENNRPSDSTWRKEYPSVKDKLRFLLENRDAYHDVIFIVGKDGREKISAHKLILRLGSPCFEKILFGLNGSSVIARKKDSKEQEVFEIREVEPFAFRYVLRFLYTDEFNPSGLSSKDLMMILSAARVFEIPDLQQKCVDSLRNHVTEENAIQLCELGKEIHDTELREVAFMYICRNAKRIFFSPYLMELCYENLSLLIQKDELELDELIIFKSVVRWADEFCKRKGLDPAPTNLRGALGEIIYKVRFPLMSAEHFSYDVIPTKVLTSEEQVQIFKFMCLSGSSSREPIEPTSSFNCKRRNHMLLKLEAKAIKEEIDETITKFKTESGGSPNCQPSLAYHSTDITENESEDTSSHVSSVKSQESSQPSTQKKRKRSHSPSPKYSKLFGKAPPRSYKEKTSSNSSKKRESNDPNTQIYLKDCEIEFNQFIEDLSTNSNRREIESIRLTNVTITDREKGNEKRVRLPKLKDFHLDIKLTELKHSEINTLAGEACLQDFFIFTIKVGKSWNLNEIWSLGINISLVINGITMISVDHEDNKLVINKLKEFNDILESVQGESGLKRLVLSHQIFPSNPDFFPSQSLDQLVLLSIKEIPVVNRFLRKFKKLRELSILSTELKRIDLSNDLLCKEKLRKFAIGNCRFSLSSPITFKNLEELFIWKCDWVSSFEENIHNLFPKLKKLSLLGSKANPSFLRSILKIKTIEEIACGQFDWNSSTIGNDNGDVNDIKELLTFSGLTDSEKSFVLSRSLDDEDPEWIGQKITFEMNQEQIYNNFQFYHLYVSYDTFRS